MIHFEAEIFESYKYIKTFSFKKQLSATNMNIIFK